MPEDAPGFHEYQGEMFVSMTDAARIFGLSRFQIERDVRANGIRAENEHVYGRRGRPRRLVHLADYWRWRNRAQLSRKRRGVIVYVTDTYLTVKGRRYALRVEEDFVMASLFCEWVIHYSGWLTD